MKNSRKPRRPILRVLAGRPRRPRHLRPLPALRLHLEGPKVAPPIVQGVLEVGLVVMDGKLVYVYEPALRGEGLSGRVLGSARVPVLNAPEWDLPLEVADWLAHNNPDVRVELLRVKLAHDTDGSTLVAEAALEPVRGKKKPGR